MKSFTKILLLFVFLFYQIISAQDIKNISKVNIDDLSDVQIEQFVSTIKSKGFTMTQAEGILKSRGMQQLQLDKLKTRIRALSFKQKEIKNDKIKDSLFKKEDELVFGLTNKIRKKNEIVKERDSLYGYDFFNNPSITFTPNINVSVPDNYRLGKGDVVQIDVWGAAEASYKKVIDGQGDIYVENVGRIKLAGLNFGKASIKIKSYLAKIYSGVNAFRSSYNKIYVGVALAEIRNVQVNLVGEVKTPGTYSLSSLSTVLNALYAAGGPTKEGDFRKISLVRGGVKVSDFDFYKYLLKGSEKGNVQLQDQDVIIVGSCQHSVTVLGEVKRPGYYQMKDGEAMSELFKYSGGLTAQAFKKSIIIQRVLDDRRQILDFDFDKINNTKTLNGDVISVKKISDIVENQVSIDGAVKVVGTYEYSKGMTVGDLIDKASGLRKNAFIQRGLITRYISTVDKKIIPFSLVEKSNVLLKSNDQVYVYNVEELRAKQTLRIQGAVNKPQEFEYIQGMQIEDLIVMAGGLAQGANTKNIEVSRRKKGGGFKKLGESFKLSTSNDLSINKKSKFHLIPYDVVSVRFIKGFTTQKKVNISGEVSSPGEYLITSKDDRISDLITRSGGLSPYAFIEGATLIRKKKGESNNKQHDFLQELQKKDDFLAGLQKKDSIKSSNLLKKKEFRIGINLKRILENKKGPEDLSLEEGDELIIPTVKQTVEVRGEVYSPSLVQYIPGKSLRYYVNNAGGFSYLAKKNRSYVIYTNGAVNATKSFLGFRNYPKIKPGATILVPKKVIRRKMTAAEVIGISSGIGTLGLIIMQLTKK